MTSYTQDSFPVDDLGAGASGENAPRHEADSSADLRADSDADDGGVPEAADDFSVESAFFSSGEPSPPQATPDGTSDWLERSGPTVPPLERVRPERPSVLPPWLLIGAGVAAFALITVVLFALLLPRFGRVSVPRIIGLDVEVARTRLAQDGLSLQVVEHRFSSRPAGLVLVQSPAEGTRLRRNDPVRVVISAGTEEFAMPDVIGDGRLLAQGLLETKGLDVRIETSPSEAPSDTVLSTNPAPGQRVHTGDIVRVVVASTGPSSKVLLPYDLTGVTVVIDPEPVADGQADVPLDVARRLRSLIEASHGKVVPTRALADTGTAEAVPKRAERASAGTATAAVGLSVVSTNPSGVIVFSPIATLPQTIASGKLSAKIVSSLGLEGIAAKRSGASTDTVLGQVKSPWARVQLGSYSSKEDVAAFTDPAWEDSAARGLYRAIGEQYGKKGVAP